MKVSVIVPVYNGEAYLAKCLDSILAQTYSDMEIVVVDDAAAFFLLLARADTPGSDIAAKGGANDSLPGCAALPAMDKPISRGYVLALSQFHGSSGLVDDGSDFLGQFHHTVSSSLTL